MVTVPGSKVQGFKVALLSPDSILSWSLTLNVEP